MVRMPSSIPRVHDTWGWEVSSWDKCLCVFLRYYLEPVCSGNHKNSACNGRMSISTQYWSSLFSRSFMRNIYYSSSAMSLVLAQAATVWSRLQETYTNSACEPAPSPSPCSSLKHESVSDNSNRSIRNHTPDLVPSTGWVQVWHRNVCRECACSC
jgi:hypothetical protein